MKSDSDIKRDAEAEPKWDPQIDASDIAAAVKDGVETAPHTVLATIFLDAREADDRIAVPTSKANQETGRLLVPRSDLAMSLIEPAASRCSPN